MTLRSVEGLTFPMTLLVKKKYNEAFRGVAWEKSRHLATLPLVSPPNDVWETSTEIAYWCRVTTQIWVENKIKVKTWRLKFDMPIDKITRRPCCLLKTFEPSRLKIRRAISLKSRNLRRLLVYMISLLYFDYVTLLSNDGRRRLVLQYNPNVLHHGQYKPFLSSLAPVAWARRLVYEFPLRLQS